MENNNIKLSIIIPQYKETEQDLNDLFYNLNAQIGVDFNKIEILLVNDHSDCVPSEEWTKQFKKLNVKILQTPKNGGPGVARQYGIDHCRGEIITFIDADDLLYGNFVLSKMLTIIDNNPNIVVFNTSMVEESDCGPEAKYTVKGTGITWLHGRYWRRRFLIDHNIRFPEDLRLHEDVYFIGLAVIDNPLVLDVPEITYIWRSNPNSLTRSKKYTYLLETSPIFLDSLDRVIQVLLKENRPSAFQIGLGLLFHTYYVCQSVAGQDPANADLVAVTEEKWYEIFKKYGSLLNTVPVDKIAEIQQIQRAEGLRGGFVTESETFNQWSARIVKKYSKNTQNAEELNFINLINEEGLGQSLNINSELLTDNLFIDLYVKGQYKEKIESIKLLSYTIKKDLSSEDQEHVEKIEINGKEFEISAKYSKDAISVFVTKGPQQLEDYSDYNISIYKVETR